MIAIVATAVIIEIAGAIANSQPIDVARAELLLEEQLPDVGHRLQDPERADAVRAVAVLEAARAACARRAGRSARAGRRTAKITQRLEQLDPPRPRSSRPRRATLMRRAPTGSRPVGGIASGAERRHLGGPRRRASACAAAAGAARRPGRRRGATSTSGSVEQRWPAPRACPRRGRPSRRGTAARSRTAPRTRVPLEPTSTGRRRRSRAARRRRARARPPGCGRRKLQRRRDVDLLGAPQRAEGAEPQRARRRRGAARGGTSSVTGSHGRHLEASRPLALRPAHAAAADLVERQAGVERDRLEQLPRGDRPGGDAEVVAGARGDVGDHLPAGAHAAARRRERPAGGRSRGAGAARGRRGA